jgi:hypothetical protein
MPMYLSPTTSRPIVFISFASTDLPLATEFYARLQEIVGPDVNFFLAPKSIVPGRTWPSEIDWHLREAACVIIILSDAALRSSWVLFEAGVGHGRPIDVIPVALAGFNVERGRPPLSFLQTIYVATADQLNDLLYRISLAVRCEFTKRFVAADLAAIVAKASRPSPQMDTAPLLTRREIFDEASDLVTRAHPNSIIRGASSLVDNRDAPDRYMRHFNEAVRAKFLEAISIGGRMRYDIVLGIHRDGGAIPAEARAAITRRAALFRDIGAIGRLRMRESTDAWSMNLLLVNDHDAILAFPEGTRGSRLRYGIRITGIELVAPIVHWYENGLKKGTKRLKLREYV